MKMIRSLFCFFLVAVTLQLLFILPSDAASFGIILLDPPVESALGNNEKLYINISYESVVPIRFLASAMRDGEKRDVGAVMSPATLHASGKGEALIWIAFANPTHIDEVVVTAYDEDWNRVDVGSVGTDTRWTGIMVESPREPSSWVKELQKKERLKLDYLFDPSPNKPTPVSDSIFVLALLSIPTYLFLQVRMLRRYKLRWRELATVPLITALPMVVYALWVGIGFNLRLWPPAFLYFVLASCGYLMTLWLIKRVKSL